MTFIQEWAVPSAVSFTGTATRSGTATGSGHTLFVDAVIRSSSTNLAIDITDSAGTNTWVKVDSVGPDASAGIQAVMFACYNANSVTSISVTFKDATTLVADTSAAVALLSEHTELGVKTNTSKLITTDGGNPTAIAVDTDYLIRGIAVIPNTTRTWTKGGSGVTTTARNSFSGSQVMVFREDGYASGPGTANVGWTRATGSAATPCILNAVFGVPVVAPPSPTLDASLTDNLAEITSAPSSGTPPYTFSIAQTAGPTTTPALVDDGTWLVLKDVAATLTYEVTITDDNALTATDSVSVPPIPTLGSSTGIKRPTGSLPSTTWV